MSDGYAIRPTDEELAEWTSGAVAQGFPEYYEDRHYELLDGMFEELIESRAAIARVEAELDQRYRDGTVEAQFILEALRGEVNE